MHCVAVELGMAASHTLAHFTLQVYEGPMEGKALQKFVTDVMPDHLTPEVMPENW